MKKLYSLSENCNTWNSRSFENTSDFNIKCSSCSAFENFSCENKYSIWRWEIDIPFDWKYGEWTRIRLYPVLVTILLLKCISCGEIFRVYPSFVVEGTTLTLSALIFIAFVYESSDQLTWRLLPELFCEEHNKISHSTLYKAVHGFGKSLNEHKNIINEGIVKLTSEYLQLVECKIENSVWITEKSTKEDTLKREAALRSLLSPIAYFKYSNDSFVRFFFRLIKKYKKILSNISPPVKKIYIK